MGSSLAYLVNPQSPHDDIVHGDNSLPPCVVALGAMKNNMAATYRGNCKILASELGYSCELLPERPIFVLYVLGKHWRVVTHLREDRAD